MQALVPGTEDEITAVTNLSKVHSLKAAIFHTMAYKLSLEINKNKITQKTLIAFLKVLYNVSQIKKITFEQYSRIHLTGPKIAICETASNVVFVLNSAFTTKDQYIQAALQEATMAFNSMLQDFGHPKTRSLRSPHVPSSPSTTTSFILIKQLYLVSLIEYISLFFLHLS